MPFLLTIGQSTIPKNLKNFKFCCGSKYRLLLGNRNIRSLAFELVIPITKSTAIVNTHPVTIPKKNIKPFLISNIFNNIQIYNIILNHKTIVSEEITALIPSLYT